jgi:zinc protease
VSIVRGGSTLDPAGQEGLAHLVEHLTYRAVDPAPGGGHLVTRWDRLTKQATVDMNGFTLPDCLQFYEFGPPARLPDLLALEAARLAHPLAGVDDSAVALEKQVIGSEHLLRTDARMGGGAGNVLFPLLFPAGHPYAHGPGGTDDSRGKLTFADARAYAARSFTPERITLLVSAPPGVTSLAAILEALPAELRGSSAAGVLAPGSAPARPASARAASAGASGAAGGARPAAAVEKPVAGGAVSGPVAVERRSSPLPRSELWVAWRLPGSFGELGATEDLLQRWVERDLGAADLSREDPHIRSASAWMEPGLESGVLFVRTLLSDGADAERAAQVVVGRVASLWAREQTSLEAFAELRAVLETERVLGEPGQISRALDEATYAALAGRVRPTADAIAAAGAVPSSAAARLAYQELTRERARTVLFSPAAASSEASRAGLPAWHGAGAGRPSELVPNAPAWDPSELARMVPEPLSVSTTHLPTGLTVITVRRPATAAVAWLGFRGGYSDADPPLLLELALRTRPEARQAPRMHILPGRGATRDLSFEAVEFLPAQLPDALTLLFAKAGVPAREWPNREGLERLLAPVAAGEDGQAKKATRAFWHALLGDHPYARMVATDDLDKVTRSDVDGWIARVHNLRNAALVVVGDVAPSDVERTASILAQQMKTPAWVAELPTPPAPTGRPATGEHLVPVITARAGGLTDVRMGCLLPPMAAADRGHYELLEHAIEARLNTALRVEQGDGYGVSVGYERLRGGATYLVASTFVPDASLARTLATLRANWQRWSREGFDAGEINVARWRYAGSLSALYGSSNGLAVRLLNDWNAEPASVATGALKDDVAAPRASRVGELFATCKANAVLGLTGNEAAIRRALEQAWPALTAARHATP